MAHSGGQISGKDATAMSNGFVDIHCHILPETDDGARDMQESLAMAAIAADDGVEIIVATPHADHTYPALPPGEVKTRIAALQTEIDRAGIQLKILPGADVHIDESLPQQVQDRQVTTLGDTQAYLLLELPHDIYIPFSGLIYDLETIGVQTILSHPERNGGIQADIEVLWGLVEQGCLMQVTAGSITGELGSQPQATAMRMLKHRLVHFVASDAHSSGHRKPVLSKAWRRVAQVCDGQYADLIFKDAPRQVIAGVPLEVPKPAPLAAKSLLARILGR